MAITVDGPLKVRSTFFSKNKLFSTSRKRTVQIKKENDLGHCCCNFFNYKRPCYVFILFVNRPFNFTTDWSCFRFKTIATVEMEALWLCKNWSTYTRRFLNFTLHWKLSVKHDVSNQREYRENRRHVRKCWSYRVSLNFNASSKICSGKCVT